MVERLLSSRVDVDCRGTCLAVVAGELHAVHNGF
jgi:hypothetical protein